jgi:alpha-L-fucosidase
MGKNPLSRNCLAEKSLQKYGHLAAQEDACRPLRDEEAELLAAYAEKRLGRIRAWLTWRRIERNPALRNAYAHLLLCARGTPYGDLLEGSQAESEPSSVKLPPWRQVLATLWATRWRLASTCAVILLVWFTVHMLRTPRNQPSPTLQPMQAALHVQGQESQCFKSGEWVSVPPNANGAFGIGRSTEAAVASATVFKLVDRWNMELQKGTAWLDVQPGGQGFRVRTPYGDVRVKGTSFGVTVTPDGTRVDVARGTVQVEHNLQWNDVEQSERVTASPAGLSPKEARAEGANRPGWVASVEAFRKQFVAGADRLTRAREMQDLKRGLFIHWGIYVFERTNGYTGISVADASLFRPTGLDAEQWVLTAKEAGMRYILFAAKNSDGFCLWDTKVTLCKVTNSPLRRDVLEELRRACEKHGIGLALYYAPADATWPKGRLAPEAIKAQVRELMTQYGPIEFLLINPRFGDGGLPEGELAQWVHKFQPGCLVNLAGPNERSGDMRTRDCGPGNLKRETDDDRWYLLTNYSMPLYEDWSYREPADAGVPLPLDYVSQVYTYVLQRGGILSLGIGPAPSGRIPERDVALLQEIGKRIQAEDAKIPLN